MNNDRSLPSHLWSEDQGSQSTNANPLLHYIQALNPEVVARLSRPESNEVMRVMEQNILGLLGNLPTGAFNVEITTNRENLGRLLASAMMSGYFLRNAEQRFAFEQSLEDSLGNLFSPDAAPES